MMHKLAMLTVILVCVAAALLLLRQQRIELANRNAVLFWEMQQSRRAIWSAQARGAALVRPADLQQRIKRAKLKLEPAEPEPPPGALEDPRRWTSLESSGSWQ